MPKAALAPAGSSVMVCSTGSQQLLPSTASSAVPAQPSGLCGELGLAQKGLCADVLPAAHGLNIPDTLSCVIHHVSFIMCNLSALSGERDISFVT